MSRHARREVSLEWLSDKQFQYMKRVQEIELLVKQLAEVDKP